MSRKPPDFELWTEMTRSVKPLRKRKPVSPSPLRGRAIASAAPAAGKARGGGLVVSPPERASPPVERPPPLIPPHKGEGKKAKSPPPNTGFDRRTTQKMTRGNVEIERRLDLHGTGVELARVQLLQFLRGAHGDGVRTVLVITGKGSSPFSRHTLHGAAHFHSPERQGQLRRLLPEWLHEPEFRILVSGFQPAHPKHGGGGAYYVKIRRAR
ncbi:MAG: Smr/MutS family protein [Rhizobiales bacterium]|nr:Smr/MutS family protein [Hyphomicrobiales bacterium]